MPLNGRNKIASLSERRNASVLIDVPRACVIAGQYLIQAAVVLRAQVLQIGSAGIDVRGRVENVLAGRAELPKGRRHELHITGGAPGRNSVLLVRRFGMHYSGY